MKCFTSVILLLFASCWTLSYAVKQLCRPLQYVEYRSKGTLICTFEAEFLSLFWYDYHDATTVNPVLIFDEYGKSGSGYESGEYDMYSNGSLIINEVSMSHDRNFTVVARYSQTVKSSTIEVVVTVLPEQSYPVIANCDSRQNCFITMIKQEDIVCLVSEAKPATNLEWYFRSSHQDNVVPTVTTISKGAVGYVTKAVATYQLPQSYSLKLFICKGSAMPSLLRSQESQMLVEFNANSFYSQETSDIYVQLFSNYTMKCTETNALYIVWKQKSNSEFENIAYATFGTDVVSQLYSTGFHLEKDGSLTVLKMSDRHETLICCVSGEGQYQDVTSYALKLYDLPVPPFPVIDGCSDHLGCRIVAEVKGNLTCTIRGVRPKVDLKWVVIGDGEVPNTFFKSHHLETKEIGSKFDVIVTSQYELKQSSLQKMTLECRCNVSEIEALMLVATVELYFPLETSSSTLPIGIIIGLVIGVIILVTVIAVLYLVWRCRPDDKRHKAEGTPTLTTKNSTSLEGISSSRKPKPPVNHPERAKPSSTKGAVALPSTQSSSEEGDTQSKSTEDEPLLQDNTSGKIDNENQPNSGVGGTPMTTEGSTSREGITSSWKPKPAAKLPLKPKPSSEKGTVELPSTQSSSEEGDTQSKSTEDEPLLQDNTSGKIDNENQPNSGVGGIPTTTESSTSREDNQHQTSSEVEGTPTTTESSASMEGKKSEKSDKRVVDMKDDRGDTELAELFKNIQNGSMNVQLKNVIMKSGVTDLPMKVEKNKTDICFDIPGGYDLNQKTVASLIRPSLLIDGLKEMSFHHCYMPYKFISKDLLQAALKDKKITVKWVPRFKPDEEDPLKEPTNPMNLYVLNTVGQWEEMETQKTLIEGFYKTRKQGWKAFEDGKKTEIKDPS